MGERDSEFSRSRFYQYQKQRRKFSTIVYGLAFLFGILALLQWLIVLLICNVRAGVVDYFYISLILLLFALFFITLFVFFETLRFILPLNWFIALLIIECVIWGLARTVAEANWIEFLIAFGITTAAIILFLTIGVLLRHDLTLDVVILFVVSIIFFIFTVIFAMTRIIAHLQYATYFYAAFVIVIVLCFIMYHAQTINGGRYAEMRLSDFLLGALIIFHDFVIMFLVVLYIVLVIKEGKGEYLAPNVHWECHDHGNGTAYKSFSTTTTTMKPK